MSRLYFLGPEGSFHHEMALRIADDATELVAVAHAEEVCMLVAADVRSLGILAIENKLAGPVNEHLKYILESGCRISGQYWLPVHHHLLAAPGMTLEDVVEVNSHPMAFRQCRDFLAKNSWKFRETSSTSAAAKELLAGRPGAAVIASAAAMEACGLICLQANIEDAADNATRFFLLHAPEKNDIHTTKSPFMASFYTPASAIPHMLAEAGGFNVRLLHGWDVPQHDLIYTEWIAETSWPEHLTHTFESGKALLAGSYGLAETGTLF